MDNHRWTMAGRMAMILLLIAILILVAAYGETVADALWHMM